MRISLQHGFPLSTSQLLPCLRASAARGSRASWRGVKLVALPAVALVLARAMNLSLLEQQMAVVMAAVPTATSAYILAVQMKVQGPPVAVLISLGTLLAAVTLPLWIAALT